jgi:hypothetical protein
MRFSPDRDQNPVAWTMNIFVSGRKPAMGGNIEFVGL